MRNSPGAVFKAGDSISFNYFGKQESGVIETVGKHGYWIKSDPVCYGSGSKRCPFEDAVGV
jgi:hypothetical protein